MIGIDCPWCGDEMELADVMAAATLRCDGCATEFEFADDASPQHAVAAAA